MRIVRASLKYLLPVIPARENANSDVFKNFGVVPGRDVPAENMAPASLRPR